MNGNANLNANNLTPQNIIEWREKLGVPSLENVLFKTDRLGISNMPQNCEIVNSATSWGSNATITLNAENSFRIFYGRFNATTNNRTMYAYDDTAGGTLVAQMGNINGYNQYHLMTVIVPPNREFRFRNNGISCVYYVYKIT